MRHAFGVPHEVANLLIVSPEEPGIPDLDDPVFSCRDDKLRIVTHLADTV